MRPRRPLLLAGLLLVATSSAQAGVYGNQLAQCLVESSTSKEKMVLIRWMFSAMSTHPGVQSLASISTEEIEGSNRKFADLTYKLLTRDCSEQTTKALKYEGQSAIESSFQVLGQVAAKELFSHPNVAENLSSIDKYMKDKDIEKELGIDSGNSGE